MNAGRCADFNAAFGIGKLVTSITMTVFYVLLYHIGCLCYQDDRQKNLRFAVYILCWTAAYIIRLYS